MIHFVCKFSISRLCWFPYGLKKKTENLSSFFRCLCFFFSRLRLNLFLFALNFPLSLSRSLQFISNKEMEIFLQLITDRWRRVRRCCVSIHMAWIQTLRNTKKNKKAYKSSGLASSNKSPSAFVSFSIVWYWIS